MTKTHLRRNKAINCAPVAVCASKSVNGLVRRNSRSTYQFMASEVVGLDAFRAVSAEQRCAHCMDAGLTWRNSHRRAKGLPPITSVLDPA